MNKQEMRQEAKCRLGQMDPQAKKQADADLRNLVSHYLDSKAIRLIAIFYPMKSEPDLLPLMASQKKGSKDSLGLQFCFPRVDGQSLRFFTSNDLTSWSQSSFGVNEPDPKTAKEIKLDEIEVFFVPGLAFDRNGHRLGRGQGFYDRLLSQTQALKLGVGFSCQLFKEVPKEGFDQVMDLVFTEQEIINPAEMRT